MPLHGKRLRELRQRRGYTQEELAALLNLGQRQIPRYESGETDPSADIIARMARALGVTADYLLGLTDEPSGHLAEDSLSPMERKLITAMRHGLLIEALEALAALSKRDDESVISAG
jgi:transcriptional regulator with XRE-family HTH domain